MQSKRTTPECKFIKVFCPLVLCISSIHKVQHSNFVLSDAHFLEAYGKYYGKSTDTNDHPGIYIYIYLVYIYDKETNGLIDL